MSRRIIALVAPARTTPRVILVTRTSPILSLTRGFAPRQPLQRGSKPFAPPRRWQHTIAFKPYSFEDVRAISEQPSKDTILIDVREPAEFAEGAIPSAINIPLNSQPDALLLPPADFQARFGFAKPPLDRKVVFYCRAGVRSKAAAQIAVQGGYERVGDYSGSWLDWAERSAKK